MRRLSRAAPFAFAVLAAAPAAANDRVVQVGSFARLRIEAPVEVVVTSGSPRATVSGDPRAAEWLDVRNDTGTLVVRLRAGGPRATTPLRVALSSPSLTAVVASGGARVTASGLKAPRVDLALAGSGLLAVDGIDAGAVMLTVAGNGRATLAGKAATARLTVSGAGAVNAGSLAVGDLTLTSSGAGETVAAARYTAAVSNSGAGTVTVLGTPKCTVRAGSGPVTCGAEGP